MGAERAAILLVDDNTDLVRIFDSVLKRDFQVDTFSSPTDALAALQHRRYAAVVSDYSMRPLNGLELLQQVAEQQPQAARVLVSAAFDPERAKNLKAENVLHAFLAKPVRLGELQRVVSNLVQSRIRKSDGHAPVEYNQFFGALTAEIRRSSRHKHNLALLRMNLSVCGRPIERGELETLADQLSNDPRFHVRISDTVGFDQKNGLLFLLPETTRSGGQIKGDRLLHVAAEKFQNEATEDSIVAELTVVEYPSDATEEVELLRHVRDVCPEARS